VKKWILLVVVGLGVALYFGSDRYAVGIGPWRVPLDPDRSRLHEATCEFLRSIQFKDFTRASTLHTDADRAKRDLPQLIEKKFAVPPELLDIRHFEVVRIDVWPEGNRAKSVNAVTVKLLNSKEIRDVELVLYWKKNEGRWYMDLQSSL
jgi:hypothetical protein